jgi:hypothetical protein
VSRCSAAAPAARFLPPVFFAAILSSLLAAQSLAGFQVRVPLGNADTQSKKLSEPDWSDDHPVLAIGKDGRRWVAWISYQDGGDAVTVNDGSGVRRVTVKGDHRGAAIAVDARGWVHVAWAQREGSEFHIYESVYLADRWSRAFRLTQPGSSNVSPVLATDGAGRMALVWQSLRNGQSVVMMRGSDGRAWSPEQQLSVAGGNAWAPAAAWGGGKLWVTWDAYNTGNYQIYTRTFEGTSPGLVHRVSVGGGFAIRPSVAVTPDGVPIVAWEESDALFASDFPFLTDREAATLSTQRRVRLAYLDSDRWLELPSPVEAPPPDLRGVLQQPQISLDSAGRLYLAFRARPSSPDAPRRDHRGASGSQAFLTQLAGDRWQPAIVMPSSTGRGSMRPTVLATGDAVHVAWSAEHPSADVYATTLPASGPPTTIRSSKAVQ